MSDTEALQSHIVDNIDKALTSGWSSFVEGPSPQGAQGVGRIAALLKLVASQNASGLKLNELTRLSGLEQSTAHRIASALHSVGFLSKDPKSKRYHLGPLLFELFTTAFPHFNIHALCVPAMKRLAASLGDTVYLTVRSGLDGVCIERIEGSYPIRTCTVDVGKRRPLGIGAGSLALLAGYTNAEAALIIRENAARYEAYGTDESKVRGTVETTRRQGHVYQDVLGTSEIRTVALPVRGHTGHPFAGLSITAISNRIPPQRAAEMLVELAAEIEHIRGDINQQGYI